MIMSLFGKNHPIGLDLGTQCIKMVQIEQTKAGMFAAAAGKYHFPADTDCGSPQWRELAVKAVKGMLKEHAFRGRKVVAAMPDTQLAVKIVRLSQTGSQQIEQVIRREAADKLPFDIESAQLQYLLAGNVRQGNETRQEIIVLAVQQESILDRLELLSEMSLEPLALDIGPCALFRGFRRFLLREEDERETSFVVDIGATTTKVAIGHGSRLAFVKIIEIGSLSIARAVAEALDISLTQAVDLRRRTGGCPENKDDPKLQAADQELSQAVIDASRPLLSDLGREISLCLRYHGVMFRGYRPENIVLTGGEACSSQTVDYLSQALSLPVQTADPFRCTNTSEVELSGNRRRPAPGWAVSVGLALRGLVKTGGDDHGEFE